MGEKKRDWASLVRESLIDEEEDDFLGRVQLDKQEVDSDIAELADDIEAIGHLELPVIAEECLLGPVAMKAGNWSGVMTRLDGKGPPLKKHCRQMNKKKAVDVAPAPNKKNRNDDIYANDPFIYPSRHINILPYFDGYKHGYYKVKNKLMYKTPDGLFLPATGVDEFGPFRDKPHSVEKAEMEARFGKSSFKR
jgi:hypothetical protein